MLLKLKDGSVRIIMTSSTVERLISSYKPKVRDKSKSQKARERRVSNSPKGRTNVGDIKTHTRTNKKK